MEASEIDAFGLIGRIKKRFAVHTERVCIGMGDDATILPWTPGNEFFATLDLLIEGIYFDLSLISLKMPGRKSSAVNLNDITAIGCTPLYGLLSWAVPAGLGVESLDEFGAGLVELADPFEVSLVGSNALVSPTEFLMNLWKRGMRSGITKIRSTLCGLSDMIISEIWKTPRRERGESPFLQSLGLTG